MQSNGKSVAFVLHMGCNGLGIARSLGRYGIPVIGVDFDPNAPGFKSKFCRSLLTPHPRSRPQKVLESLLNEGRRLAKKSILYPVSDDYVLFVSRFRSELSECFLNALPSADVVESLIDKRRTYQLAEDAGIPYPETRHPENIQDVEQIKDNLDYPVFIKPRQSHVWQSLFSNKGYEVNSPSELVQSYALVFRAGLQAMVQSIVTGPDSNIVEVHAYLSQKGEPLATFVARKLRQYPPHFGSGSCMESIHNEQLVRMGMRFFQHVSYTGTGFIEFKKDEQDGNYRFIEANARPGLQNLLPTHAGVNFPLIQYLDLTGQPIERIKDYVDGVRWLNAIEDFLAYYQLNRKTRMWLVNWVKSLLDTDCHAYFAYDDLNPFVKRYATAVVALLRRRVKISLSAGRLIRNGPWLP